MCNARFVQSGAQSASALRESSHQHWPLSLAISLSQPRYGLCNPPKPPLQ